MLTPATVIESAGFCMDAIRTFSEKGADHDTKSASLKRRCSSPDWFDKRNRGAKAIHRPGRVSGIWTSPLVHAHLKESFQ